MQNEDAATFEVPEDFAAFEDWRNTGKPEPVAPAAEQAKTAPDSGTETPQETTEEQPGDKAVKGVQKRIDELTKARREAERRAEEAERKLANQGSRPATETAQSAKPADEAKPKLEDFATLEEFQEALTDYKLDQREKAKADKSAKDSAADVAKAAQDVWNEREEAYKAEHADYAESLDSVEIPNTPAVPAIQQALSRAENGPAILHHLAKNPDELQRIAALSPVDALMEIGALKAKLSTAPPPEKPQPKVSSAPKPPARVGGTAPTARAIDDPNLSFEDHEKLMAARERRRK